MHFFRYQTFQGKTGRRKICNMFSRLPFSKIFQDTIFSAHITACLERMQCIFRTYFTFCRTAETTQVECFWRIEMHLHLLSIALRRRTSQRALKDLVRNIFQIAINLQLIMTYYDIYLNLSYRILCMLYFISDTNSMRFSGRNWS